MLKRLVLTGSTLRARPAAEKAAIRAACEAQFWSAVESGGIVPVLDRAFPADRAEEAQALMTRGGHVGKIVLQW